MGLTVSLSGDNLTGASVDLLAGSLAKRNITFNANNSAVFISDVNGTLMQAIGATNIYKNDVLTALPFDVIAGDKIQADRKSVV